MLYIVNEVPPRLKNAHGYWKGQYVLLLFGKCRRESFGPQAYCIVKFLTIMFAKPGN